MYQGEASAEFDPAARHEEGPEDYEDCDPFTIFHLIHPLGRGSYGSVYKARVYETGEIVAVKIIPLTEQDEIGSIQKEVAVLRECNHPNVVKYYGSWRTPDSLWICMEYCAGGSVSDIMAACDCALEEDTIAYICSATLAGLAYLHSVGKVHRDIKCGNILLTEGGEVKLADFGVAAQLTNTMSKRNTFIGTPHWMAPEVIQTSHYDGKVDVWALGVCAIEMAERFPPRWKVNPNRVIFMIVRDPPPRLADKERWSLAFQDFVAQCLNKDSRMRPTAKYLQQHKFVARDKAAAVRAILPMVNRARAYTAEIAAAAARAPTPNNNNDDGVFSWRDGAGFGGTRLARSPLHAQHAAAAGGASGGAYGDTLPASSPHFLKDTMMSPGSMLMRSPPRHLSTIGTGTDASGTVLVKGEAAGGGPGAGGAGGAGGGDFDYGGTVRVVPGARTPAGGANGRASDGFPGGMASGTVVFHESPSRPTTAASPAVGPLAQSSDYLAAVRAVSEGQPSELELAPFLQQPTPGRPAPARAKQKGPKSEAQRMIEKLHNLYSSGAVVPLPFLRSTDAAPLSLLGLERGPPNMPGVEHTQQGADWETALAGVLEEASGGGNEGWGGMDLPPMVQQQVQSSPVLLNLATTLAHHKRLLEQVVASQEGAGWVGGVGEGSGRLRAQLATKADDLADTLRTILCL